MAMLRSIRSNAIGELGAGFQGKEKRLRLAEPATRKPNGEIHDGQTMIPPTG